MKMMFEDLIIKLRELNKNIKDRSKDIDELGRDKLKAMIYDKIATKYTIGDSAKLSEIRDAGGLWAVDGSLNRIGALYPHYISVIDALVISTKDGYEKRLSSVYSPMLTVKDDMLGEAAFESDIYVKKEMARLEVKVCIEALKEKTPRMIFMDGGFIRYIISCKDEFDKLKAICLEKDVILVGVIEEIKTSIIAQNLELNHYDREVLFSLLDYKEAMLIKDEFNNKSEEGITSAFARTSIKPYAIGVDMCTEQKEHMKDVLDSILSLTPKDSRGIPIILDIVDKKVKISDAIKEEVLIKELDKDVYDRYFNEVRNFR